MAIQTQTPTDIVRRFCAAWSDMDLDVLADFFTNDAVYHNIPLDPVVGRDNIKSTIAGFTAGTERVEFRVNNIAADGPIVLTERTDVFVLPNVSIELPVMGTFEVHDGKIAAWRDYFDMKQFMDQMTG